MFINVFLTYSSLNIRPWYWHLHKDATGNYTYWTLEYNTKIHVHVMYMYMYVMAPVYMYHNMCIQFSWHRTNHCLCVMINFCWWADNLTQLFNSVLTNLWWFSDLYHKFLHVSWQVSWVQPTLHVYTPRATNMSILSAMTYEFECHQPLSIQKLIHFFNSCRLSELVI